METMPEVTRGGGGGLLKKITFLKLVQKDKQAILKPDNKVQI